MTPRWFLLGACVSLAACASAPRDGGFSEVQRAVEERTAQRLEWHGDRAIAAPASDTEVEALLSTALTVDRAVEVALRNNRDLQATLETLGIARADLLLARTLRNPVLDLELRFPGSPAQPLESALMQPLFDLLHLRARRAAGEAAYEVTRLRVTGAVLAFASRIRLDFFGYQAARQLVVRQGSILEAASAAAELAQRQHDAGNISDLDLESEQALYEQAKLDNARVALEESQSRERMVADLGLVDPATPFDVGAQLPEIPAEDKARPAASTRGRIDLALARAELEAARRNAPLARSAVLRDVAIGAHHDRGADGQSTNGPAIAVPIPIFDLGRARKAKVQAEVRRAEQRLYALDLGGQSQARAAADRVNESRSRAAYIRDVVVPRRERILALLGLEHSAMLRGPFDLIRARQDLDRASRDQIVAVRDYWIARTELEAAENGVLSFRSGEPQSEARSAND